MKKLSIQETSEAGFKEVKFVDDSVGRYIFPAIAALRCIGTHPFSTERTAEGHFRFYCRLFSVSTLYSIVVIVIWIIFLASWFAEYIPSVFIHDSKAWFGRFDNHNSSTIESFTMKVFPMVNPALNAFHILSSLTQTNNLLRLINNWLQFEKDYKKVYPLAENPFKRLRFFRLRGFILGPVLLVGVLISGSRVNAFNCDALETTLETNDLDDQNMNEKLCRISTVATNYVTIAYIIGFLEDFKQILLLQACKLGYQQIRISSKTQYLSSLEKSLFISRQKARENVRKWMSLLLSLRNQVKLTGVVLTLHHVLNIMVIFIIFCFSIFMQITIALKSEGGNERVNQTSFGALSLCFVGSFRFVLKANLVETLMSEEQMFANDVRLMKESGRGDDLMTRLEMSMLIDFIERKPIRIHFGGLMTLNYSLLLKIIGQVATYLVVLVQFNIMEQ